MSGLSAPELIAGRSPEHAITESDMKHHAAGDDELDEELTEGFRGMADVEDLLWDDETEHGVSQP